METAKPPTDTHLTAKCPQHNLKINVISKQPDGTTVFMCKLCKPSSSNGSLYYLADLLDDEVTTIIEEKLQQQLQCSGTVEEKHSEMLRFIDNTFDGLKREVISILEETQKKVQEKFLGFVVEKKAQEIDWKDVKKDFETKRESFLKTSPLAATEELSQFLETYSNVMKTLTTSIDAKKDEDFHINREEIKAFRKNAEKQAAILADKLIRFNLTNFSIKLDTIKEDSSFNTDFKGVYKAIAALDDLNMFAMGSIDGELTLWDSNTMKKIDTAKVHNRLISSILYVPNRKVLVTASLDRTIKVFEVAANKINFAKATTLTNHKSFIYGLCLLEDQNKFASIGHEAEIKIWNLSTMQYESSISTNGWASDSYEMVYIQEEGLIGVVGKDVIRFYNVNDKTLASEIVTGGLAIQSIQYLKKQRAILAGVQKGKVRMWNLEGGQFKQGKDFAFEEVGDTPYTLLALEEQNLLVVMSKSKWVIFVNLSDGAYVKKSTQLKNASAVCWIQQSGKIVVADNQSEKAVVFGM